MLLHTREGSGEHRVVEINSLVEESLNLAYHGARAEKQGFNINLERSLDPAAGEADVFPQDITRALLNLISNGFYAATKRRAENGGEYEPTLDAATKNLGDRVEITIRENGTGVPDEVKEKMFNPFFTISHYALSARITNAVSAIGTFVYRVFIPRASQTVIGLAAAIGTRRADGSPTGSELGNDLCGRAANNCAWHYAGGCRRRRISWG